MKPMAIIYHTTGSSAGLVAEVAKRRNIPSQEIRPYLGEPIPSLEKFCAVVSLGGPQGAYQTDEYPYLQKEANYLAEVVEQDIPLLAICLGSQILAVAAGGHAHPGTAGLEAGVIEVQGRPGYEIFSGHFISFHSDAVKIPPGAEILADSDQYLQAWRLGSALAIQFHPELDSESFASVLEHEEEKLKYFGVDVDALREGSERYRKQVEANGLRVIAHWFDSWEEQLNSHQLVFHEGRKNV